MMSRLTQFLNSADHLTFKIKKVEKVEDSVIR
jgi:hypothetical protein